MYRTCWPAHIHVTIVRSRNKTEILTEAELVDSKLPRTLDFERFLKTFNRFFLWGLLSSSCSVGSAPFTSPSAESSSSCPGTGGAGDGVCLEEDATEENDLSRLGMSVPCLVGPSPRGVVGRLWLSEWCVLALTHLVFAMSSRATGRTGTRGCWNAILTHPFQFFPDGMNCSTSCSNYAQSVP